MSAYKLNATYQQMQLNMALRFAVVKACAKKDVPCYMVHSPHSPTAPQPSVSLSSSQSPPPLPPPGEHVDVAVAHRREHPPRY